MCILTHAVFPEKTFSLCTHAHVHTHGFRKEQAVQNMHVVNFCTVFTLV